MSLSRGLSLPLAIAAILGCCRVGVVQAQQGNWKDRAESELYESVAKETAPARKLELLNSWKEKYPATDFVDIRQQLLLAAYGELGRPGDVLTVAGEILAREPNNLQALSAALVSISSVESPSADQLATAERAANQTLSNLDTLFAAAKKPERTSETDWAAARRNVQLFAQNALGYVAWQRKEFDAAEAHFLKSLRLDANQPQVSYWLSSAILAERKPDKYSAALYDMARAAAYKGPGALNDAARKQVLENFQKTYVAYHGGLEGSEKVLDAAAIAPLPPENFKIPSKADVVKAEAEKQQELERTNPQLALWRRIRTALTGPQGRPYFEEHMKDAELPEFRCRLIEAKPADNPRELLVSVEDGKTPDTRLVFSEPLPPGVPVGAELAFKGVPKQFSESPFLVVFSVERNKLTGWKGLAKPKGKGILRKPASK